MIFKTLYNFLVKLREGILSGKKPFLFLFLVVVAYYLISGLVFGFTYESNDDSAFENCLRGVYWNTHISNFYFYYRGIALFFVWLYQNLDIGINWYGWSLIFEGGVAFIIITYLLFRRTKSYWPVILFMMLYLQSIFLVSFTRISIFLSFAALFLLFSADQFQKKKTLYLISTLLFIWAYLMRPNAGMLSFFFLIPFIYTKYDVTREFLKKVLICSIPVIIAFTINFFISSFQDKNYTQNIQNVAKHTFPIIDYNIDVSSYSIEQKQIVYELKNWFFFDNKLTNINTYKDFPSLINSNIPKASHIIKRLSNLFSMIFHKPFFALLMIFSIVPLLLKKPFPLRYILSVGYFFSILFTIAVFLKLEYRIVIPFLTIFFIFVLFDQWPLYLTFIYNQKILPYIFLATIFILFLFQTKLYYKKSNNILPQSLLTSLSTNAPSKTFILLTDPTLNYKPTKYVPYNSKLVLVPARGWMAYTEQSYLFQQQVFCTTDITKVFKEIGKRDNIFFISNSEINGLVRNILSTQIKGAKFVRVPEEDISNSQVYVFKIDPTERENSPL